VTDADVLALNVHLATMRAQQITADAEERVARTRLNDVIGATLDEHFELDERPGLVIDTTDATALEREALATRQRSPWPGQRRASPTLAHGCPVHVPASTGRAGRL